MKVHAIIAVLVAVSLAKPDCYNTPYHKDADGYCECYDWDDTCLYWTYAHSEDPEIEDTETERMLRDVRNLRIAEESP